MRCNEHGVHASGQLLNVCVVPSSRSLHANGSHSFRSNLLYGRRVSIPKSCFSLLENKLFGRAAESPKDQRIHPVILIRNIVPVIGPFNRQKFARNLKKYRQRPFFKAVCRPFKKGKPLITPTLSTSVSRRLCHCLCFGSSDRSIAVEHSRYRFGIREPN